MPDGPGRFPQGFTCPAVLRSHSKVRLHFKIQGCHLLWPVFPNRSRNAFLSLFRTRPVWKLASPADPYSLWSCNPALSFRIARFRLFRVRSPLLAESLLFSLPRGTEMVHFPPFASSELCVHSVIAGYCPAGLPHSDISGSKPVCGSPKLFAAYRVLLRLSAPRHPPCTLSSLTNFEYSLPGESYRFLPDSVVKEP